MSTQSALKNNKLLIHGIVILALMLIIGSLPPIEPITPLGMKLLGVFVGMLYGWVCVDLVLPSIIGILMWGVVGNSTITDVFMEGFGNSTVILLIFIFVFSTAINEAGIGQFFATWLLTRKALEGKPWVLTSVFLLAAFFVSATVNTLASMIICWGIMYELCDKLGMKAKESWPSFMVFGITIAAILGGGSFAFKTVPAAVLGVYQTASKQTVDFLGYSIVFWTLSLVVIIGTLLLGRIMRTDVSKLKAVKTDMFDKKSLDLTRFQKVNLFCLALLIVTLMAPAILPDGWALTQVLNKLTSAGIIMAGVAIIICINVGGKPLVEFVPMAKKSVLWEPIILTAAVVPIGNAMMAEDAGISAWLSVTLGTLFSGMSVVIFSLLSFGLALILTNFANNGMTAVIFLPLIIQFSSMFGMSTNAMAVLLIFTVHVALVTPAACPMSALMFANKEWIEPKYIIKIGVPLLVWTLIAILAVGLPVSSLVFN